MQRIVEGVLFLIALVLLAAFAWGWIEPWMFEAIEGPAFDRAVAAHAEKAPESRIPRFVGTGSVLARLEVPTAGVSSLVVEGVGEDELSRAVGRIPGTARFGEPGTVGLAGHRDAHFLGLGKVHPGDSCTVVTPGATYAYVIESTVTVPPDSAEILYNSTDRRLALVTCYPFRYIGPAPERFIVFARQVTGESTEARERDESSSAAGDPFVP